MYKQYRISENTGKQANKMSPKACNPPITEPTDIEMYEIPDKELQKLIIKMIDELKEDLRNE